MKSGRPTKDYDTSLTKVLALSLHGPTPKTCRGATSLLCTTASLQSGATYNRYGYCKYYGSQHRVVLKSGMSRSLPIILLVVEHSRNCSQTVSLLSYISKDTEWVQRKNGTLKLQSCHQQSCSFSYGLCFSITIRHNLCKVLRMTRSTTTSTP